MFEDQFFDRVSRELTYPFRSFFDEWAAPEFPALNVWSSENDLQIVAEIPGVDPESLDVSIVGDTLTMRGERKPDMSDKGTILRKERLSGTFYRTLSLPYQVEADKVTARCSNGMLYLTLPRSPEERPKKITVQASH